jgi:DNA-binding beta-propeller fold protein YncE
VVDSLTGNPATFNLAIPVAATPVTVVGPAAAGQRNFSISQNNQNTPATSVLPFDVPCNISPTTVTQTGEADTIEISSHTVSSRIPLGRCPVYAVVRSDNNRLFVLNRGDDTITVINSQTAASDSCVCPATGCLNQNGQAYFCHPTLPLSTTALHATGIVPINCNVATDSTCGGMPAVAGPVYAEYNPATSQLIVSDYDGGTISVIDVSLDQYYNDSPTFGTTYTIPVGNNPASVTGVTAPDGSVRAYTANQTDSTVTIVNLSSHTVEKTLPVNGHPRTVVSTANSLYGKVYVASPDSPLLTIIRTDLDITDTTILVPGNIVDVRVSTQNGTTGNKNTTSRLPGGGQPCNLPPALMLSTYGPNYTLADCQTIP